MKKHSLFFALLLPAALLLADPKPAADPQGSPPKGKVQTTIQSDFGDFDYKSKKGIFEGNVVVVDTEMKLKSDKLIVYLDEKDNTVTRVEAMGSVIIEQQGKTAYADNAVYRKETGVILLTPKPGGEKPKIKDANGNVVRGNEIVINRNDNTMKAVGAEMEYTPGKKDGQGPSQGLFSPPANPAPSTNDTTRPKVQ